MRKIFRTIAAAATVAFLMGTANLNVMAVKAAGRHATVLFTHDMHDHFFSSKVETTGKVLELGGYSRLSSAIKEEKQKTPDALLVDAGDFSMGTLFQSIYASDAPELKLLGSMGYDAVTLGNHEYDFRAGGLADSLEAAKQSKLPVPQIVQSNVVFPKDKAGDMTDSLARLKKSMEDYGVKEYTVIEHKGIKYGVFGLIGKDAASNAPMSEVKFDDIVDSAKKTVDILKNKEKVDIIVCLSHSGTDKVEKKSEDDQLAEKVPEINLIVSGHTHTKLVKPIIHGNTAIVSCGEYSENLGVANFVEGSDGSFKLEGYNLKQIDDSLPKDEEIEKQIEEYKNVVQEKYLKKFDLEFDEILAYSPYNYTPTADIGLRHEEDTLGNLISDAYIYMVKKAEGKNYEPVDVALVPSGTIRGSFVKGNINVYNAFAVSSLGIGPDKVSGYPLISVYLTGKELKTACEVDASVSPIMTSAQLYMSGISFTFNPNRLIFNKVTRAQLQDHEGKLADIDNNKLYRVVATLYSGQMLSVVGSKSFGLLSVVPKTKDGKEITDFEKQIIKDTASGRNNEVKEWLAVAEYLKSFPKVNGLATIPSYYGKTQGRKIVEDSLNPWNMVKNPNMIALVVYGVIILIIVLIAFITSRIVKSRKRKSKRIFTSR